MKTNGKEEKGGGGGTAGVSIAPVGKDGKEEEKPFGELERDGWGKGRKRAYCSSLPSFSVDGSPSWRRTIYANIILLLLLHPGYHIIRPEWRRGKFVGTSGKTNPRCPNAAKRRRHDLLLATLLPLLSPPPLPLFAAANHSSSSLLLKAACDKEGRWLQKREESRKRTRVYLLSKNRARTDN